MNTRQPVNYLDFKNPVHIIWRKGTSDDPYIDRLDISKVVNQRLVLLEIPDELYRVRIKGMTEINYEKFIKSNLAQNEFYCDYTNGFIYFNASKEAETISVVYKGRGIILYPSNRIVHYDGSDTVTNLHEIIENSKIQVRELIDRTDNFEEVLERMTIATNLTQEATDNAIKKTEKVEQALELVNDAYATTVLIYQPYVQTYKEILTTYPNPLVGWTVQVYETGVRYRWNGQDWTPIDQLGGNLPVATEEYDGLMSIEHFLKVEDISEEVDSRTIVFIVPKEIIQGVQDPHIVFPHDGEILEATAFVSGRGQYETKIDVQKSTDFQSWVSILDKPIEIEPNRHKSNMNHSITNKTVSKGDIFRIEVINADSDAINLTVNITIKIN